MNKRFFPLIPHSRGMGVLYHTFQINATKKAPWDSRGCIKKPRRLLTQGVGAVAATDGVVDSTAKKLHVGGDAIITTWSC